jgi:hypothetical protein
LKLREKQLNPDFVERWRAGIPSYAASCERPTGFEIAALIAEKKDDFGGALQNLYRELERAENLVGPS